MTSQEQSKDTRARIFMGIRRAFPVICGYIPIGFAFGVLAAQNNLPPLFALFMSLMVYAGSSQLVAIKLLSVGTPVLSMIVTTLIINLRHVLMSTALAPWLSKLSRSQLALFGFQLTDETFALHSKAMRSGEKPLSAMLFTCNAASHMGWVVSTAIGVFFGSLLVDTRPFALDYALPAMFIALLIPQIIRRIYLLAAIFAGMLSLVLALSGVEKWNVITATVVTASLGTWLMARQKRVEPRHDV
jgi:4-azaleucine resistance transporter AzlC